MLACRLGNKNGTSSVIVDRLTPYIERYGAMVIFGRVAEPIRGAVRSRAITTAPTVTHWVPALITGFNSIVLERLSQLNGQVEFIKRCPG